MNAIIQDYWFEKLSDEERAALEPQIRAVVFDRLHGNPFLVLRLISEAQARELDRSPLVAAVLWVMRDMVED